MNNSDLFLLFQKYGGAYLGDPHAERCSASLLLPFGEETILTGFYAEPAGRTTAFTPYTAVRLYFPKTYELSIQRKTLLRQGVNLLFQEAVPLRDETLNQAILLTTNQPDFTEAALGDPTLRELLLNDLACSVSVQPVSETEGTVSHVLEVLLQKSGLLWDQQKILDHLCQMVELTKACYDALMRYPML
jgi:hypothetical protein